MSDPVTRNEIAAMSGLADNLAYDVDERLAFALTAIALWEQREEWLVEKVESLRLPGGASDYEDGFNDGLRSVLDALLRGES